MRLSMQTDYALRTLIYLADRPGRSKAAEVAEFYQISSHHLAKVAQQLTRLGYVRGIRGIGGGIELAREPESICIGEVVKRFEGNLHLLECVGVEVDDAGANDVCVIHGGCRLRGVLAHAEHLVVEYLNSVSLRDVLGQGGSVLELPTADDSPAKSDS
ncbi:MAG: Rrf2 family transcriptional regulator [Planctomycetales bacterium]